MKIVLVKAWIIMLGPPWEMADDPRSELARDPMQKFVAELERQMKRGVSRASRLVWATQEIGVDLQTYERLEALIIRTWRQAGRTLESLEEERAEKEQMYLEVFHDALEAGKHAEAIKALDSIREMKGIDVPEQIQVGLYVGQTGSGLNSGITNDSRTVVASLIAEMRRRVKGETLGQLREYNDAKEVRIVDAVGVEKQEDEDDDEDN